MENLTLDNKIALNGLIRKYKSDNTFILSLQKQLKSNYCSKIEVDGKNIKILSDKQYQAAQSILFSTL